MSETPAEPDASTPAAPTATPEDDLRPITVDTARIVEIGIACWLVALLITLVVPSLHSGDRDWWPWTCVAGIVLGLVGLAYVRRGRGNAADARQGQNTAPS